MKSNNKSKKMNSNTEKLEEHKIKELEKLLKQSAKRIEEYKNGGFYNQESEEHKEYNRILTEINNLKTKEIKENKKEEISEENKIEIQRLEKLLKQSAKRIEEYKNGGFYNQESEEHKEYNRILTEINNLKIKEIKENKKEEISEENKIEIQRLEKLLRQSAKRKEEYKNGGFYNQEAEEHKEYNRILNEINNLKTKEIKENKKEEISEENKIEIQRLEKLLRQSAKRKQEYKNGGFYNQEAEEHKEYNRILNEINRLKQNNNIEDKKIDNISYHKNKKELEEEKKKEPIVPKVEPQNNEEHNDTQTNSSEENTSNPDNRNRDKKKIPTGKLKFVESRIELIINKISSDISSDELIQKSQKLREFYKSCIEAGYTKEELETVLRKVKLKNVQPKYKEDDKEEEYNAEDLIKIGEINDIRKNYLKLTKKTERTKEEEKKIDDYKEKFSDIEESIYEICDGEEILPLQTEKEIIDSLREMKIKSKPKKSKGFLGKISSYAKNAIEKVKVKLFKRPSKEEMIAYEAQSYHDILEKIIDDKNRESIYRRFNEVVRELEKQGKVDRSLIPKELIKENGEGFVERVEATGTNEPQIGKNLLENVHKRNDLGSSEKEKSL